jgi:hypothetical protein
MLKLGRLPQHSHSDLILLGAAEDIFFCIKKILLNLDMAYFEIVFVSTVILAIVLVILTVTSSMLRRASSPKPTSNLTTSVVEELLVVIARAE